MTTTIKVSDDLRDRLKAQAARSGLTLGAHLSVLADLSDRRDRLASLRWAIADTPADELEDHLTESAGWETAELDDARHV